MNVRRHVVVALAFALAQACVCAQSPGPRALIFVGLVTNRAQADRLHDQAAKLRTGLQARGLAADAIQILPARPDAPGLRRESILDALATVPPTTPETWVILLGTVAPGRGAEPSFQVSGPRLTAADFAAAVAKLPGNRFVLLGASAGGGFLPALLPVPGVEAVAATAISGEINEPRFPLCWAEALTAKPDAPFLALATDAAGRVAAIYRKDGIAQSEHAHRLDRAQNAVVPISLPPQP